MVETEDQPCILHGAKHRVQVGCDIWELDAHGPPLYMEKHMESYLMSDSATKDPLVVGTHGTDSWTLGKEVLQ